MTWSDHVLLFLFLFGVFAILMLPLASVFFSAALIAGFEKRRVVLSLVIMFVSIPTILALLAPQLLKSPYLRFMDKDQKYYANLARACDTLLQQHSLGSTLGTNKMQISLAVDDSSIPPCISALHPSKIFISTNSVWIMVGVREFGISWTANHEKTNCWELHVQPDGPGSVVYTEIK